jgi:hypothetical protein
MNQLHTYNLTKINNFRLFLVILLSQLLWPAVCYSQVEPMVVPLIAGQHINVGTVSVTNTESEIIVTYQTSGDWLIKETHLDVELDYSGLNTTKKGNPIPGKFSYHTSHSPAVNQVTFTIENFGWTVDSELYIAAHAVVTSSQGTETAWGEGMDFPGRNWGMYFTYTVQAQQQEAGVLEFSSAVYTVDEPGRFIRKTDVVIKVIRTNGTAGELTANYTVSPGTATKDADYIVPVNPGSLTFADGEVEKTFVVTILDDSFVEDPIETINLELDASCCLGDVTAAQIDIRDDDVLH